MYFGSASRCDSLALGIFLALYADRLPRLTSSVRFLLVGVGYLVGSPRLHGFQISWDPRAYEWRSGA